MYPRELQPSIPAATPYRAKARVLILWKRYMGGRAGKPPVALVTSRGDVATVF